MKVPCKVGSKNQELKNIRTSKLMNINSIIIAILVLITILACGDDNPAAPDRIASRIAIDGIDRTYLMNLPSGYKRDQYIPLVIVLHGFGGNATQAERDYGWTAKAERENFAVVYPDGIRSSGRLGLQSWNAGTCCEDALERGIDDVKFISTLVDKLVSTYAIDTKRIYVTGMSNGGMFTYRLACEMANTFAAIASVSGPFLTKDECQADRAVPILHIHSKIDQKIPFLGGIGIGGYYYPPADSGLLVFRDLNDCVEYSEETVEGKYVYRHWKGCTDQVAIESYVTVDGGHSWPGGLKPSPRSDEPSNALSATDKIWDFFVKHPLP
jgi:polyhydroxybutyrate depolymerase